MQCICVLSLVAHICCMLVLPLQLHVFLRTEISTLWVDSLASGFGVHPLEIVSKKLMEMPVSMKILLNNNNNNNKKFMQDDHFSCKKLSTCVQCCSSWSDYKLGVPKMKIRNQKLELFCPEFAFRNSEFALTMENTLPEMERCLGETRQKYFCNNFSIQQFKIVNFERK